MIPSPFHGIFSSFTHNDERSSATAALKKLKEEATETTNGATSGKAGVTGKGQVALDIFEFDNYYILKAPIAGVKLSDIDIDVHDNVLTIRGTRRQTDTTPDNRYYLKECFWGDFERSVTLPCSVDPRKVKATFNKECVLKIIVPKEERVKIVRVGD